ncbi:MAG: response regulator [Candidatus Methanofastidiosa archaeon]|nr:response regulator [Candidatus Methanofastidiosa archaeon]
MVKVLIAEDYLELLDFYKISLDYELFLAKDGEEALEMFKKHRPDIVLMDIKLPKKDGLEVTREILSIDPDARVIAITAYGYLGPKALEVGAKEVIRKPFKMSELNELINKYAKK